MNRDNSEFWQETRLIAHAGGVAEGVVYSNSVEAIEASLAANFTVLEFDITPTADGSLALRHGWNQSYGQEGLGDGAAPTLGAFLSTPMENGLTPAEFGLVVELLVDHPDVRVILDPKVAKHADYQETLAAAEPYLRRANRGVRERLIPQLYWPEDLPWLRQLGYGDVVYAPRKSYVGYEDSHVVPFMRDNNLWMLSIAATAAPQSMLEQLDDLGGSAFTFTVNDLKAYSRVREKGFRGVFTDHLTPQMLKD